MGYIEAGPAGAEPVLLPHGEPTWSFLWPAVIPTLVDAGLRVIAPDLIGFGRSDKPPRPPITATPGRWRGPASSRTERWTCAG